MIGRGWHLQGAGWWLAAFLLLLSRWLPNPITEVPVIQPAHDAIIGEGSAWDVPLLVVPGVTDLMCWSVWLAAAVASCVIGTCASRLAREGKGIAAVIALLSAGYCAVPTQMVLLLLTVTTASHAMRLTQKRCDRRWAMQAVLILTAGSLLTIDFGLLAILLFAAAAGSFAQALLAGDRMGVTAAGSVCLIIAGLCTVVALLDSAWAAALLRPVSAVRTGLEYDLVPWLASPLLDPQLWPVCLGLLLLASLQLRTQHRASELHVGSLTLLFCLLLTGFGSRYWLGAAVTGVATILGPRLRFQRVRAVGWRSRIPVTLSLACSFALFLVPLWKADLLSPALGLSQRTVSLQPLNLSGTVLLTVPCQSGEWLPDVASGELQLVANDRWDAATPEWIDYLAVCRDVRNGRHERYLQVDGRWGGFRPYFDKWDPLLVVLDSQDHRGIRQLSLDPAWQTVVVDARKTVFSNAASRQTATQARRASELLYYLEWPDRSASVSPLGTLEIGTAIDARQVAGVLNAMRLPYAALTVLPDDDQFETREMRAWAYTELALRAIRQTGQMSIMDHSRAMVLLTSLQRDWRLKSQQRERIESNLRSLQGHRIASSSLADSNGESVSEQEQQIRAELTAGQIDSAAAAVSVLTPSAIREYYETVIAMIIADSEQTLEKLQSVLRDESLPRRLVSEGYFLAGCQLLEHSNGGGAGTAFLESLAVKQDDYRNGLIRTYLFRLGSLKQHN